MLTIHVLACGELFQHVLNAITVFMSQDNFAGLLRITALAGIVMVTTGFVKTRDPTVFAKWFVAYALCFNLVLVPKTSVLIDDISSQKPKLVDNVPVIFALSVSLVTTIGYGLAESYDALLTMPDDLQYTQTGSLFGSRLIQASRDFRITDPRLKEEMNFYLRSCVVGDIRLNHKYDVNDLVHAENLWNIISSKASKLRMTSVNGKNVSCFEAANVDGPYSLKKKLDAEIMKAYTFYGINLFDKPQSTSYEALFETHLKSAVNYYQDKTNSSSEIFLQSMMINAVREGINNYQTFTDATAGIVNQQFSKSQAQHRWSWEIAGIKALWFLPMLHTWLTILLFGVFPLIIALATLPGGIKILYGYFQFFFSLQFWPVLFAILNAGMTIYGSSKSSAYGQFTMVNIDKIDELHSDISGMAGYIMMLIPFLANGLVSNLGGAFNSLATSMTGHVQGSTMAVAGEAASGSFSLGQTSFYNSSSNNLSANKHDSNWTNMHGMTSEQMSTGVVKTLTGSGDAVFDVGPGMSRTGVHISDTKALSGSMSQAFEESKQAASNESRQYQTSLSNFAHRALQLSQIQGHDMRLGDGVSENESGQYSNALSTMAHIASDVAKRTGVSQEDAMAHMTSAGINAHAGLASEKSILGHVGKLALGAQGGVDVHAKADHSSTSSDRYSQGTDMSVSAKEAADFNKALNYVDNFAKSHHFDDSHSEGANISNQLGADLRDTQTASHNFDASMSRAQRIQTAKSYVESKSDQITADLNQAFPSYVASRMDEASRDELFAHPGDMASVQKLQELGSDFIAQKREGLIAQYGNAGKSGAVDSFYQHESQPLTSHEAEVGSSFSHNSDSLQAHGKAQGLGIDTKSSHEFRQKINHHVGASQDIINQEGEHIESFKQQAISSSNGEVAKGKELGQKNLVLPERITAWVDHHDKNN